MQPTLSTKNICEINLTSLYIEKKMQYLLKVPTFSGVRFHTMTECPELRRFFTIPAPIMPSPRKPNFSIEGIMFFSLRVCVTPAMSKGGVS